VNAELVKLAREVIETYQAVATIREECEAAKTTAADADKTLPVEVRGLRSHRGTSRGGPPRCAGAV
jgi:hypothetical protein